MKAEVFRPHIAPPTMTLEEFADLEVKDALEREKREKDNPPSVIRRLSFLSSMYSSFVIFILNLKVRSVGR